MFLIASRRKKITL